MAQRDVGVMHELLERVRAATGPDPVLDRYLCHALDIAPWAGTPYEHLDWCSPGSKMAKATPALTGSLDAATASVRHALPGWSWQVRESGFGGGDATLHNPMKQPAPGYDVRADHASRPCLALIAALLTNLIAQEDARG